MTTRRLLGVVLLLLSGSAALANDYRPGFTLIKKHIDVSIDHRGLETVTHELVTRFNTERAVTNDSAESIVFSPSMEKVEVLEAYTIDTAGNTHRVPRSAIREQDSAYSHGAPQFSDYRYKLVIFPNVAVGASTLIRYRTTRIKAHMPGHTFLHFPMAPSVDIHDARVTVTHPSRSTLHVAARGMQGHMTDDGRKRTYRFVYTQPAAQEPEDGQVDSADFGAAVRVSSYQSMGDLGRDYFRQSGPKISVTPEIRRLAEDVTRGMEIRRAQIDALYRWVSHNIRYVSVIIDRGGLIANPAPLILSRRYGDCKDHVTLLASLLRAKGIDSVPALINLGDAYTLPEPAVISPLNHVILYVPEEDLYLDSTTRTARTGQLYDSIAGKPVVLTSLGRVGKTPHLTHENNWIEADVRLEVRPDGHVMGTAVERQAGDHEVDARGLAISRSRKSMAEVVRTILTQHGERGTGKLETTDPYELSRAHELRSEFTLQPLSNIPGPGGWRIPRGLTTSLLARIASEVLPEKRSTMFICASGKVTERYTIAFPKSMVFRAIPPDIAVDGRFISYHARYRREGNSMNVERVFTKRYGAPPCGPEEWQERWQINEVIQKDLRAQFVYD